jgi:hypothetical protein
MKKLLSLWLTLFTEALCSALYLTCRLAINRESTAHKVGKATTSHSDRKIYCILRRTGLISRPWASPPHSAAHKTR